MFCLLCRVAGAVCFVVFTLSVVCAVMCVVLRVVCSVMCVWGCDSYVVYLSVLNITMCPCRSVLFVACSVLDISCLCFVCSVVCVV